MEILIDLDIHCNNKCIFCSKNFIENFIFWISDLEILKKNILSKINEEGDIFIWWPEPFNSPILYDLLIFIKNVTNKKIIIKTSWVLDFIDIINPRLLSYIDKILIPINSLDRDTFNYIHWNPKAFDRYYLFIKEIKKNYSINKLVFHILILKENYNEVLKIFKFLYKNFNTKELVLVYPIKPLPNINEYYNITVPRKLIIERYERFISKGIFRLVNFDKPLKYYEKNSF